MFRHGGMKLKKGLGKAQADYQALEDGMELKKDSEKLQGEYNMLEGSRDTWQETCEALQKQVNGLRNQIASDNTHNDRRI